MKIAASRVSPGRGNATSLGSVKTENSARDAAVQKMHAGTQRALRALWLAQGDLSLAWS